MRVLLQRVSRAEVRIGPESDGDEAVVSGRIGAGYVVLVGFTHTDTNAEVRWMAEKLIGLRLFPDDDGRLNRNLIERAGTMLVVSQFTLYADVRKGRRPSFVTAAASDVAISLYNQFIIQLRALGITVETGQFGAHMNVELVNDGPVTIWLEREADALEPNQT
jgi:D-tyrosyl-tRNA(Tyr) deacylase